MSIMVDNKANYSYIVKKVVSTRLECVATLEPDQRNQFLSIGHEGYGL